MTLSQAQLNAQVAACLGDDAVLYLTNKARGGSSGRKGARYEDFFTAFKVAEAAAARLSGATEWLRVQEQARAFVDDLRLSSSGSSQYFQLKNVQALAWSAGTRSLVDDFRFQKVLSEHLGEPSPRTVLVVSSNVLFEAMRDVPAVIAQHSEVVHFPFADGHGNRLVQEHAPLREALKMLCRSEEVTLDALEGVLGVLIIGMMKQNGQDVSVESVLASARSVSPHLIRLFPDEVARIRLDPAFVSVLAAIDGFEYVMDRGFFEWSFYDTSGVTSYDCLSEDFDRLQRRVISQRPITFEDLEELL